MGGEGGCRRGQGDVKSGGLGQGVAVGCKRCRRSSSVGIGGGYRRKYGRGGGTSIRGREKAQVSEDGEGVSRLTLEDERFISRFNLRRDKQKVARGKGGSAENCKVMTRTILRSGVPGAKNQLPSAGGGHRRREYALRAISPMVSKGATLMQGRSTRARPW